MVTTLGNHPLALPRLPLSYLAGAHRFTDRHQDRINTGSVAHGIPTRSCVTPKQVSRSFLVNEQLRICRSGVRASPGAHQSRSAVPSPPLDSGGTPCRVPASASELAQDACSGLRLGGSIVSGTVRLQPRWRGPCDALCDVTLHARPSPQRSARVVRRLGNHHSR